MDKIFRCINRTQFIDTEWFFMKEQLLGRNNENPLTDGKNSGFSRKSY